MTNEFFLGVILFFILAFRKIYSDDCPEIYKRYSTNHSYCKPKNSSCNILRSYLTQGEIDQVLSLHNSFRSTIATQQEASNKLPPAANMLQMEYDGELAAVAQNYADQCIYAHDCPSCRRVPNFGVGQNIAIQRLTGNNLSPPQPDWSFAVGDWFEEIVYFSPNLICNFQPPNGGGEYRHFTQLIWARTFRIGCGYTMFQHGNTYTRLYICNYGPAGNTYGSCVYDQGPACSACPENTCCGEYCAGGPSAPGLCKRINNEPPRVPPPQPNLFYCDFTHPTKEDCLINVVGKNNWYIIPALGGNYLEAVLDAGESSTLIFDKKIKPDQQVFCVQIWYRKGPNIAGNQISNTASEVFVIPQINDFTHAENLPGYAQEESLQFAVYNLTLQWGYPTDYKLSFSVPQGTDPQFLNVRSILAMNGGCG